MIKKTSEQFPRYADLSSPRHKWYLCIAPLDYSTATSQLKTNCRNNNRAFCWARLQFPTDREVTDYQPSPKVVPVDCKVGGTFPTKKSEGDNRKKLSFVAAVLGMFLRSPRCYTPPFCLCCLLSGHNEEQLTVETFEVVAWCWEHDSNKSAIPHCFSIDFANRAGSCMRKTLLQTTRFGSCPVFDSCSITSHASKWHLEVYLAWR